MNVWVCAFVPRTIVQKNVCAIDKIVDSQEKADAWLEKAEKHQMADLRFWYPIMKQMKVE